MPGYADTMLQGMQGIANQAMMQRRLADTEQNNQSTQNLHAAQLMRQYQVMQAQENQRREAQLNWMINQRRLQQSADQSNTQRNTANDLRIKGLELQLEKFKRPQGPIMELTDDKGNTHQVRSTGSGDWVDARTSQPLPPEVSGTLKKPMPLPQTERKSLEATGKAIGDYQALLKSFKPDYAGSVFPVIGEMQNVASQYLPGVSSDRANWWREYQRLSKIPERHGVAGSALTPREIAAFEQGDINPGMKPEDVITALNRRLALQYRGAGRAMTSARQRYNPQEIESAVGISTPPVPTDMPDLTGLAQQGARYSGVGRPPLEDLLGNK